MHASGVSGTEAVRIFDILYDKAWKGMGGRRVLGDSREAMRTAYEGSLMGGVAPHFWLEIPLRGEPHSDLHVSYGYGEVAAGARFAPGAGWGYPGLFSWFAHASKRHTGIDLTFDLGRTEIKAVGAYVCFADARKADLEGFCSALGRPHDATRCRKVAEGFPQGWRVWYASPFPHRQGNPVRAAALCSPDLQNCFSRDPFLVREHLSQLGISTITQAMCQMVSELSQLPVTMEWRVTMDGQQAMRDRCDVSFYLSNTYMSGEDVQSCFCNDGAGTRALELFERWGGADERWRDVVRGSFAQKGPFRRDDGSRAWLAGVCSPSCFMLPWEHGRPVAAKAYPKLEAFWA